MSTAVPPLAPARPGRGSRARWALADSAVIVHRNLLYLRHNPGLVVLSFAAPVGFLVAFTVLFGGAIRVPGSPDYQSYLVPGILVMSAFLGLIATAGATAADAGLGVVDRLKAMPTSRAAVPAGQATADLVMGTLALAVSAAAGYGLGWRPHGGAGGLIAGFALLIAIRYALTFAGVWLGLVLGQEAAVQQVAPLLIGLTMFSNAFVPTAGMPLVVRAIADWNPVSTVTAACRHLFGEPAAAAGSWPLAHPLPASLAWTAVLAAGFVPLAVRRYARVP
jgi:ABC-2 type transport system permease protein